MVINFDTIILLSSVFLVFWKIIGLTCFTAGLVRTRNTNDILAKNVVLLAITVMVFIPLTQHIIFSQGINAYIPSFSHQLGHPLTPLTRHSGLLFELLMAVIPLYIITGATAERLRFWPFIFFSFFYLAIIYPIVAYWVWGDGFLHQDGFIDFGGAAVLHISGAVAALAASIYLGTRLGRYDENNKILPQPGANIPLAMLGAMQIWLGTIGLNMGTALLNAPTGLLMAHLSLVVLNTLIAGASGLLIVLILTRLIYGTIDVTLLFNGALAGIVAISANPVLTNANAVVVIGLIAGILMISSLMLFNRLRIDDPIGAIAVHGVGGLWGILSVSFTLNYLPALKDNSMIFHQWWQLGLQFLGLISIIAWVFVSSLIVWSVIRFTVGLRIKPTDEYKGMDIITCGMNAYPEFIIPGQEKS